MFSKHVGVRDSNEAKVLAILEALRLLSRYFMEVLIMESDSSNAIAWVSNRRVSPWRFQFHFNEIRVLLLIVVFHHNNSMTDVLAKQGVERLSPWVGLVM